MLRRKTELFVNVLLIRLTDFGSVSHGVQPSHRIHQKMRGFARVYLLMASLFYRFLFGSNGIRSRDLNDHFYRTVAQIFLNIKCYRNNSDRKNCARKNLNGAKSLFEIHHKCYLFRTPPLSHRLYIKPMVPLRALYCPAIRKQNKKFS